MEIIRIAGYTELEKLNIAKQYLIPKQREANGLSRAATSSSPTRRCSAIIRHYTKEAGVRNLEREIATVCRKVAVEVVKKRPQRAHPRVGEEPRRSYLGPPRYPLRQGRGRAARSASRRVSPGRISAASCSRTEVTVMPGKGKLIITGKLGEVMQESAQAAMSYVRSRAEELGLERDFYQKVDIHIHVPEGAIPKDGPSAGITMATALVSALTRIPVRHDVAMTGEITLRGRVLPIGGLKEKVLAAHRGGIKTVLIPKENEKDIARDPGDDPEVDPDRAGRAHGPGAAEGARPRRSRRTSREKPAPPPAEQVPTAGRFRPAVATRHARRRDALTAPEGRLLTGPTPPAGGEGEQAMTKAELIESMASKLDLPKGQAERAVNTDLRRHRRRAPERRQGQHLRASGRSPSPRARRAPVAIPKTGESIQIAASKSAKFKAGKTLKDSLN